MDSREVAQAVVEAQSETADNGSVGWYNNDRW
jgi:hypothetical protein